MKKFSYDAIILAAGESRRMGRFPKALLDSGGGVTFLEKITVNLRSVIPLPQKIIVVLGYHRDQIIQRIDLSIFTPAINQEPSKGMLSSILTGMKNLGNNIDGFLLSLVDHPLVKDKTYQAIVSAARREPLKIIIPSFQGRKGHPVYFPSEVFKDILNCPEDSGVRWAIQKNEEKILILPVEDEGILADVDTPELYRKMGLNRSEIEK